MALLFTQPLLKTYRASVFSCSYLFCFFLFLVAVVLPFFLAFSTYDFWIKLASYIEEPKVVYRKEIIVMLYGENLSVGGGNIEKTYFSQIYTSMGSINDMFFQNVSPMIVRSNGVDTNFDGIMDEYDFEITFYSDPTLVKNVKVLTFYDYSIRNYAKIDMIGMAYADIDTPSGAASIYIDGSLNFKQINPLIIGTTVSDTYNQSPISQNSAFADFLPSILMNYNQRNLTTQYDFQSLTIPNGSKNQGKVFMKVRIPINQIFEYTPLFLQVMKFAWVQYISLLLPVALMIYVFAEFIFKHQILECQIDFEKVISKK